VTIPDDRLSHFQQNDVVSHHIDGVFEYEKTCACGDSFVAGSEPQTRRFLLEHILDEAASIEEDNA